MELNLQPLSTVCHVTGRPFAAGQRLTSYLLRDPAQGTIVRHDMLESESARFSPTEAVICRWGHVFKPRQPGDNAERTLKLTAENLFLTLVDPATELNDESTRLLQFLALLLERKRLLRPRGRSADGAQQLLEHMRSKQIHAVPAGELTPEFFVQVQAQLSVLVGEPKLAAKEPAPTVER